MRGPRSKSEERARAKAGEEGVVLGPGSKTRVAVIGMSGDVVSNEDDWNLEDKRL